MEFEKLVSPSLKDLFITHVEAMILSGELPVGQQLPPERQLAQSMGVSRAVVNSGVAELERRGFLEVRPRVGTFVTDYRRAGTLDTLKSIMTYNRGRLRNEEMDVDSLATEVKRPTELIASCRERLHKAETEVAKILE